MHSDLLTSLRELQEANDGWGSLVTGLTDPQGNWRPAPNRWSIAQCMDHLNATTGKLLPPITAAIHRGRADDLIAQGPFPYGFVSRWFLRSLAPEGAKPIPAPATYRPSTSDLQLSVVSERFRNVQEQFKQALISADGLHLGKVCVTSPALSILRLPLGIWFLSTTSHMLRHLNQARRVRSDERFPSAT
jgi:DinB superfamily